MTSNPTSYILALSPAVKPHVWMVVVTCDLALQLPGVHQRRISTRIRLPEAGRIPKKAFKVHGITEESCAAGVDFDLAIAPILQVLRDGAVLMARSLMHKTYANLEVQLIAI